MLSQWMAQRMPASLELSIWSQAHRGTPGCSHRWNGRFGDEHFVGASHGCLHRWNGRLGDRHIEGESLRW